MTQRPLWLHDQPVEEAAAAFLHRLDPHARAEAPGEPDPWVWLTGGDLRVCCEPARLPATPAWRLTAWERCAPKIRHFQQRGGWGRVDLRFAPKTLDAAAARLRLLQPPPLHDLDLDDDQALAVRRAQGHALQVVASTRRAVLRMWAEDLAANTAAALDVIANAFPRLAPLGVVDGGAVVLDLNAYTPPVPDPAHWAVLTRCLWRAP